MPGVLHLLRRLRARLPDLPAEWAHYQETNAVFFAPARDFAARTDWAVATGARAGVTDELAPLGRRPFPLALRAPRSCVSRA